MATRIERIEGHNEVQETSYGEVYVCVARSCLVLGLCLWESLVLTVSGAVYCCGADHTALVREERASEMGTHP
jgi:hypothetical protein